MKFLKKTVTSSAGDLRKFQEQLRKILSKFPRGFMDILFYSSQQPPRAIDCRE